MFYQRDPTFVFKLMKGEEIQIPIKRAIIGPPAKRHFKWRFAGGQMKAQHRMLTW